MTVTPDSDQPVAQSTDRIVVAIPTATEPIHHMGDVSEPKHMTLCRLGSSEENPDLDMAGIHDAVRGVAESYTDPVSAPVDAQGLLGDDGAHVVFLGGNEVHDLHDSLLAAPELREGTGAVQQHPEFIPHVTLGYDLPEPGDDEDVPDQVVFDRLGVWDGDEHTEYPLGPSGASEETQDLGTEVGGDGFEDELVASFARHVDDPLVVNDAETLAAACTQADALEDPAAQLATRRVLMRRARSLSCQHVIPRNWVREIANAMAAAAPPAPVVRNVTDVPPQNITDVPDLFRRKTQLSALPDTALRAAYMRGVREFTMTAPQSRPPLPRDVVAQARVNSLIRLAQGDLSARTDDRDLLP